MMYMRKTDADLREQILFGDNSFTPDAYQLGQIRRFDGAGQNTIRELIRLGYLDEAERQNASPTAAELLAFCDAHPESEWVFGGYAVAPSRDDVRVTVDEFGSPGTENTWDVIAFLTSFADADELSGGLHDELRAWWD